MKAFGIPINMLVIPLLMILNSTTGAQDAQPNASPEEDEATHEALRALKREAEEAFNVMGQSGELTDLQKLLDLVHEDVVLAAMNGEFAVGKSGIIEYFNKTMTGSDRTVQSIHHTFEVADLTTLYGGDTGVAYGTSIGTYELTNGMNIVVDTNWTGTMVNEGGKWLLASFQFAPNIFDNPVLNRAVNAVYWGVGIAGIVGLLLGFFVGKRTRQKRKEAVPPIN